jgi:hypothetical protein
MIIGALHLAVMTNAELAEHGMPSEIITYERERMTGHLRRIQERWAKTIGMWGGVAGIQEIADRAEVERNPAVEYAKLRGLKWRTKRRVFTPAQLGVLAMATPGSARDAAKVLGILPIEATMYRAATTEVMTHYVTPLSVLLTWRVADLEAAWRRLDLRVEAPEIDRQMVFDEANIARVVAEAERQFRRHPEDEEDDACMLLR